MNAARMQVKDVPLYPIEKAQQAVQAAMKFQGNRGYQKDLADGKSPADALVKWGPLMFYNDPSGMSAAAALARASARRPKSSATPRAPESGEGTMVAGTGFYVLTTAIWSLAHMWCKARLRFTSNHLVVPFLLNSSRKTGRLTLLC